MIEPFAQVYREGGGRRAGRGPVGDAGVSEPVAQVYRECGVRLAETRHVGDERGLAGELVLAPITARGTPWMKRFRSFEQGFASGLVRIPGPRRRRGFDRGFVLSDHADWPGLL